MYRCFDIHLWISFTPNAAVLFVDVAIQPEVRFIAKQNSLMKIGNNGNIVLGPFDESTPCLMIVLMNCQTKLRINNSTAVKSVAILEKIVGSSGHEKVPTRGKPGLERPGRQRGERIVRQALVDPMVTRSMIRADVGVAIVSQTISRHLAEANLKSKRPFRTLPLTPEIGNYVYSGAKPDQCGMTQIGKRLCLVMNPGSFWGQMITVYGCGDAMVSGTIPPTLFYVTLPAQLV
ncbi:HTH_Tnp_Tc3_2 domain-containing protein [Trichonephila clavipes]|nr:HTH_Tnp_Tc3_2 domain-containing protein [Trichonephila clavipes]